MFVLVFVAAFKLWAPPKYKIFGRFTRPSLACDLPANSFTQACAYFDIFQFFPPIRRHLWQFPRYFGHLYAGLTASSHSRSIFGSFRTVFDLI